MEKFETPPSSFLNQENNGQDFTFKNSPGPLPFSLKNHHSIYKTFENSFNILQDDTIFSEEKEKRLMDLTPGLISKELTDIRNVYLFKPWPSELYVPADDKEILVPAFKPAPDSNLFVRAWQNGNSRLAQSSEKTGQARVIARAGVESAGVQNGTFFSEAAIGVRFKPIYRRSIISFSANLDLSCYGRLLVWVLDNNHLPFWYYYHTQAEVALYAYRLNADNTFQQIDGSLRKHEVLNRFYLTSERDNTTLNIIKITGKELSMQLEVESGQEYLFGAALRATVFGEFTDQAAGPYSEPEKIRAAATVDMAAKYEQMTIETTKILEKGLFAGVDLNKDMWNR